jgi:hypothetical protein
VDNFRLNLFLKLSTVELMNVDAAENLLEILLDLPVKMLPDLPVDVRSNILLAFVYLSLNCVLGCVFPYIRVVGRTGDDNSKFNNVAFDIVIGLAQLGSFCDIS